MLAPRMLALRALALVTAMLMAWPAAAFGGYQVTCYMAGRVAKSCCCAAAHGHKQVRSSTTELRARGCCEVSQTGDHDVVPAVRGSETRVDAPMLATLATLVVEVPVRLRRTLGVSTGGARAPPTANTPLFLKHCALLS
jgi:hypothetical protein